jgi:hypothetical protein
MEKARFLRLREDLFFRRKAGLLLGIRWPPGEFPSSLCMDVRPGVAGLIVIAVSAGLSNGRDPADVGIGGN